MLCLFILYIRDGTISPRKDIFHKVLITLRVNDLLSCCKHNRRNAANTTLLEQQFVCYRIAFKRITSIYSHVCILFLRDCCICCFQLIVFTAQELSWNHPSFRNKFFFCFLTIGLILIFVAKQSNFAASYFNFLSKVELSCHIILYMHLYV